MKNGVTFIQPETSRVSYDTKISKDVIIEPYTHIKKGVTIKDSSKILSGSYLEECSVGKNCTVGPYARIRPGTIIDDNVKIGNFVEIKNSKINKFSNVSHLSYIGDTIIGKKVNIGAGTITCNYDGINKNKTSIGDEAFIGSNTSLIAPIKIGKKAVVGAGSVVTKNVPAASLALSRPKQLNFKKNKSKNNK
jgi:N-acetylglucosamine-1-phosphate uridyltransferase (contains nucleotidyltransferase and I-patch acetyltransferase domains)